MYAQAMRRALKTYLDAVEATLQDLAQVEKLAETFSAVLESNREINDQIEDAIREVAHLSGSRDVLFDEYHHSTFEGLTERTQEIRHEKEEIDSRISELEETIDQSRGKIVEINAEDVREMLTRLSNVKLPIFYNGVLPYQQNVAPTGVMNQLEHEHNKLLRDVGDRKRQILDMQPWSIFAARKPVLA